MREEDSDLHESSERLLIFNEKFEFFILFVLLVFPWSTLPGLCVFLLARACYPSGLSWSLFTGLFSGCRRRARTVRPGRSSCFSWLRRRLRQDNSAA
jgi:hypothetical protein